MWIAVPVLSVCNVTPKSKILICSKPFFSPVQWIKHLEQLEFMTMANGELFHLESS